jgi:hypothetical protein
MDYDSLSKLRKPEIEKVEPIVETKVLQEPSTFFRPVVPIPGPGPHPVPPPSQEAMAVFTPRSFNSNHSGRGSDNFSAKSMSISDNEYDVPGSAVQGKC